MQDRAVTARGAVALSMLVLVGCLSAEFVPTGVAYPARPPDCPIEVFSAGPPELGFEEIGIVEVRGSGRKADLEDILPKLQEESCLAGGDALVLHSTNRYQISSDGLQTSELSTFATVIRWTERR